MYTFELTDKYLLPEEIRLFEDYLNYHNLDESIWDVFSCLFKSKVRGTQPLLLRAYCDNSLCGVAIVIKCCRYGRSLFSSTLLASFADKVKMPFYLWIRFGCCMDMMSNPGFFKDPERSDELVGAMLLYLRRNSLFALVNDFSDLRQLHETSTELPALPHAVIDCSSMNTIQDYTQSHRNIRRKVRVFRKKHGEYKRISGQLDGEQIRSIEQCFRSTAEKSVFYLPYQDLYLNAAITTSKTNLKNVHYFIATVDDEIVGYQAAIVTGKYLNALHGAFNRDRKTNYHAYDILFVKMTEFALEKDLDIIDFGAVINHTKAKMINRSRETSYFIYSKYPLLQKIFKVLLSMSKVQGVQQMQFRGID